MLCRWWGVSSLATATWSVIWISANKRPTLDVSSDATVGIADALRNSNTEKIVPSAFSAPVIIITARMRSCCNGGRVRDHEPLVGASLHPRRIVMGRRTRRGWVYCDPAQNKNKRWEISTCHPRIEGIDGYDSIRDSFKTRVRVSKEATCDLEASRSRQSHLPLALFAGEG